VLFQDGITFLEERLQNPCLGVVPHFHNLKIDEEDSVALDESSDPLAKNFFSVDKAEPANLRIGVIQLPHMSNFTDFNALEEASGTSLFYLETPQHAGTADVLIIPGSKNTIGDLNWLRATGWETVLTKHANAGKPIIGVCGGFQMLGKVVRDPFHVESHPESLTGLGFLDVVTTLGKEKVTRQATGTLIDPNILGNEDNPVFEGYEIHMGETMLGEGVRPFLSLRRFGEDEYINDGAVSKDGRIIGTYLHGFFDSPSGLNALLSHLNRLCGRSRSHSLSTGLDRERHFDELADHFRKHLNMDWIYRLAGGR
jgi:adenosylcobyric acid synthase